MLKSNSIMFVLVLVVLISGISFGQHEVRLPAYTDNSLFLGNQITGDTLANGQRRDSAAVYVLTRGKLYLSNTVIANSGWTIRIKANDSTTTRKPIIQLYPTGTGANPQNPPGQFINGRGSIYLSNLIMSGYWESAPVDSFLRSLQGALVQLSVAGYNLVIDSCILTNTNGNHLRTDPGGAHLVSVKNSIIANMGFLGRSNLGAGKAIDLRAGSTDTLIMMNNTFVNWQDRIIRHFQSTASIGYMRFEHNTLVNGMSYHGMLSLGRTGPRAIIRDNLYYDTFALGNDSDAVRQAEFTDSGELDQFGNPGRMTWVIANPSDSTNWTIKNNYYVISAAGQSFYDSASVLPIVANPALTKGSPLTYKINSRLGADSTTAFTQTTVSLQNIPRLMDAMMKWYRRPAADGGAGKTKTTSNFTVPAIGRSPFDFDRRGYVYWRDTLNCSYSTSNALYTGATGGYPIGDLNWFPSRYASWLLDPISDVAQGSDGLPSEFALAQNYPNPFNPTTKISFTLNKAGIATLSVYNVLGQKIATLLDKQMDIGTHEVEFDASRLGTGVYFYRLESGNNSQVRKMMLLK